MCTDVSVTMKFNEANIKVNKKLSGYDLPFLKYWGKK